MKYNTSDFTTEWKTFDMQLGDGGVMHHYCVAICNHCEGVSHSASPPAGRSGDKAVAEDWARRTVLHLPECALAVAAERAAQGSQS